MTGISSSSNSVGRDHGGVPNTDAVAGGHDGERIVPTRRRRAGALDDVPQLSSEAGEGAHNARFTAGGSAARGDDARMTRDNDPIFPAYRSLANGTLTLDAAIDQYGIHRPGDLARLERVASEIAAWDAPRAPLDALIAAYYKVQREPASRSSIANSLATGIQSGLAHPLDLLLMCKAYARQYDPSLDRSTRAPVTTMTQAYDRVQRGQDVRDVTTDLSIHHNLDVLLLRAISNETADRKAPRIDDATMEMVRFSIGSGAMSAEEAAIHWKVRNPDDFRELRIWSAMSSPRNDISAASEERIANNQ